MNLGKNNQTDTIVAFNTSSEPIRRPILERHELTRILIVGNVAEGVDAEHGPGAASPATLRIQFLCTASARVTAATLRTPMAGDAAVRRARHRRDAPAWQQHLPSHRARRLQPSLRGHAVAKVPTSWCNAHPGVCPATDINGDPRPNAAHPSFYDAGAYENR